MGGGGGRTSTGIETFSSMTGTLNHKLLGNVSATFDFFLAF